MGVILGMGNSEQPIRSRVELTGINPLRGCLRAPEGTRGLNLTSRRLFASRYIDTRDVDTRITVMKPGMSRFTLEDLEKRTGFSARRIRSWIQAGVLPPPRGRGPGPHYDEEHLERLRFIHQLPSERVPMEFLRQVFEEVPRETIRRVASGEEAVSLFGAPKSLAAAANLMASVSHPKKEDPAPPRPRQSPKGTGSRTDSTPWTTIEIEDGLELRLRGDDPDRVAWLARLARRLRDWVSQKE